MTSIKRKDAPSEPAVSAPSPSKRAKKALAYGRGVSRFEKSFKAYLFGDKDEAWKSALADTDQADALEALFPSSHCTCAFTGWHIEDALKIAANGGDKFGKYDFLNGFIDYYATVRPGDKDRYKANYEDFSPLLDHFAAQMKKLFEDDEELGVSVKEYPEAYGLVLKYVIFRHVKALFESAGLEWVCTDPDVTMGNKAENEDEDEDEDED